MAAAAPFPPIRFQDVACLGERRDNLANLIANFDIPVIATQLKAQHPGYNIFLYGGPPELSFDATGRKPTLVSILVPIGNGDVNSPVCPPKYLSYSINNTKMIESFEKHKLSWENVAPNVYILRRNRHERMTRTALKAIPQDELARDEHTSLWTIVPSKDLVQNNAGKIDIRMVNFTFNDRDGEVVYASFNKDTDTLNDASTTLAEQYLCDDGTLDEEKVDFIKSTIRQAFNDAREERLEEFNILESEGYTDQLLDQIFAVKIYEDWVPGGEKSPYLNKYYGTARYIL